MEWVGSFAYAGPIDELLISETETHYELIEYLEDEYDIRLNRDWALGWLYEDGQNVYVQWSSVEYYPGPQETRQRAEQAIQRKFDKPVIETEGQSQWMDGETFAKIAEIEILPVTVIRIEHPESTAWHGSGWPWIFQRSSKRIWVCNVQTFHYDFFEELEDTEPEMGRELAKMYLGNRNALDDFVIGRWDGYSNLGLFTYRGSDEEEESVLISLARIRDQLSSYNWEEDNDDEEYSDPDHLSKVAEDAANRARFNWPRGFSWVTSWIYLPDVDEVVIDMNRQRAHDDAIEHWEDETGNEANLDQPFEVGLILRNETTNEYYIYPEYSDWARLDQGRSRVPVSDNVVLDKVRQKAEDQGYQISGVLRETGAGRGETVSKFRPKKKRRHHVRKHYMNGFHHYDGYALFIPMWYPVAQYPEGGQIDTTGKVADEQLRLPTIIKFVSLPDKFLVGENTHHIYLLEAEFGSDYFPPDTGAIGRAWLEHDTITGVGFDFGTASGQALAIKQLTDWAQREGYKVSPNLQTKVLREFAVTPPDML